jgi:hypothetical protein
MANFIVMIVASISILALGTDAFEGNRVLTRRQASSELQLSESEIIFLKKLLTSLQSESLMSSEEAYDRAQQRSFMQGPDYSNGQGASFDRRGQVAFQNQFQAMTSNKRPGSGGGGSFGTGK